MSTIDAGQMTDFLRKSRFIAADQGDVVGQTDGPAVEQPDNPAAVQFGNFLDKSRAINADRVLADPNADDRHRALAANLLANRLKRKAITKAANQPPASQQAEEAFQEGAGVSSADFAGVQAERKDLEERNPDSTADVSDATIAQSLRERATNPSGVMHQGAKPGEQTAGGEFMRSAGNAAAQAFDLPGAPVVGDYLHRKAQEAEIDAPPQGVAGFVGNVAGGLVGMANPAKAPETVASIMAGGPIAKAVGGPLVKLVAEKAGPAIAAQLERTIADAGIGGAQAGMEQAIKEDWVNDPVGALKRTAEASATGAGIGAATGPVIHAGLGAIGVGQHGLPESAQAVANAAVKDGNRVSTEEVGGNLAGATEQGQQAGTDGNSIAAASATNGGQFPTDTTIPANTTAGGSSAQSRIAPITPAPEQVSAGRTNVERGGVSDGNAVEGGNVSEQQGQSPTERAKAIERQILENPNMPQAERSALVKQWEQASLEESEAGAPERLAESNAPNQPTLADQQYVDSEQGRQATPAGEIRSASPPDSQAHQPPDTTLATSESGDAGRSAQTQGEGKGSSPDSTPEQPEDTRTAAARERIANMTPEQRASLRAQAAGRPDAAFVVPLIDEANATEKNLTEYAKLGRGHARLARNLQHLVKSRTITPEGRDVLLEAFRDADTEHLFKRATVRSGSDLEGLIQRTKGIKGAVPIGVSMGNKSARASAKIQAVVFMDRGLAGKRAAAGGVGTHARADTESTVAVLHELGHNFMRTMASPEDLQTVINDFNSRTPEERAKYLTQGLSDDAAAHITKYLASTPSEWLAQSFAEYVMSKRVPEGKMQPLLKRIGDVFTKAVQRLKGRKPISPEMTALMEKLRTGRDSPVKDSLTTESEPTVQDSWTVQKESQNAGQVSQTAEVHGDVRQQPGGREGQVSAPEGGQGVQPQAARRVSGPEERGSAEGGERGGAVQPGRGAGEGPQGKEVASQASQEDRNTFDSPADVRKHFEGIIGAKVTQNPNGSLAVKVPGQRAMEFDERSDGSWSVYRGGGDEGSRAPLPKTPADGIDFGPDAEAEGRRQDELGFYSRVRDFISQKFKGGGGQPASQVLKTLRGGQLPADEMKWTGLDDMLTAKGDAKVTPAELQKFMDENRVVVKEVRKGGADGTTDLAEATRRVDTARYTWNARARFEIQELLSREGVHVQNPEALAARMLQDAVDGRYFDEAMDRIGATQEINDTLRSMYQTAADASQEQRDAREHGGDGAKYGSFTLPGGDNYREVLLTLPAEEKGKDLGPEGWAMTGNPNARRGSTLYQSSHFSEPNIVAHLRLKDRTTPDGKRVLFAEEIQSDWHQAGRDRGYQSGPVTAKLNAEKSAQRADMRRKGSNAPGDVYDVFNSDGKLLQDVVASNAQEAVRGATATNSQAVPPAPFSKTWHEMAFRRLLKLASNGGYDAVGWTTGKQQAERYDLAHHVQEIRAFEHPTGDVYDLTATTTEGAKRDIATAVPAAKLPDYVGKELADKIIGKTGWPTGIGNRWRVYSGLDLHVGGEGMKSFYDRTLPSYADKFAKKFGTKTEMGKVSVSNESIVRGNEEARREDPDPNLQDDTANVHLLPVTPEMRQSIAERGLPLFGPSADDPSDPNKFAARPPGGLPPRFNTDGPASGFHDQVLPPQLVMEAAAFEAARADTVGGNFITRNLAQYLGRADTFVKSVAHEIETGGVKQQDRDQAAALTKQRADDAAAQSVYHRLRGDDEEAKRWEKLTDKLRGLESDSSTGRQRDAKELRGFASKLGQGFSRLAQRYENNDVGAATSALKGLSADDREQVGRIGLGYLKPSEASAKARDAAEKVQNTLDNGEAGMNAAAKVGLKRKSPRGGYFKLRGSGLWMPQTMNAKGRAVLADLATAGRESPKFNAMLDAMQARQPDAERADLAEAAMDYFDSLSRGTNRYFERTRTLLPEDYVELDPAKVLPTVIRKNARTVAAGRVFGGYDDTNSLPEVDSAIVAMRQYNPDAADRFSKYIGMEMGKPPTAGNARARKIAGIVTGVQNVSKLSTIFGPIRNITQPWINTADYGLIPRLRGYFVDYPLAVHGLTAKGRSAAQVATRAGSVTGTAPEAGSIGGDSDTPLRNRAARGIQNGALYAFRQSQRGTEIRADAIARAAAEKGLADLASLERPGFGVRKLLTQAANGFGTERSKATIQRRMARLGLTPARLSEAVASGRRLTPDELDLAGWHMAHDTQFALTTASKPLFYENNPLLRMLAQYKTFGIRQTGLMVDRALKEAGRGNLVPLMQFGLATVVSGELLALLRDWLKGEDKSVTSALMRPGDAPKAREAAERALTHFMRGGVVGAVGDTEFGIGSYLAGPTVGTVKDIAQAGINVAKRPTLGQAAMAAQNLAEKQVPAIGQAQGVYRQLLDSNKRALAVAKLRARGVNDKTLGQEVEQRLFGPDEYRAGPNSLTYTYAARAINAGDVDAAREYMTSLLSGLDGPGLEKAIDGLKSSMASKSPLGGKGKDATRDLLSGMSQDARRAAIELDREWKADYARALRAAASAARESIRKVNR